MPTTTTRLFTATSEPPSTTAPATEIATEEEIPYFVSPLSRDLTTTTTTTTAATVISEPPKIPPPFEFDDPVNLAVVVSWVEDIWSHNWGAIEDVQPLFYEMGMGYTQVAICVSEPNQNIYVTFRGTDVMEFPDVLANLDILMDDFGPPPKQQQQHHHHQQQQQQCPDGISIPGKVQRGWNRKVFNPDLYLPLSEKLLQTKDKYSDYQVIIAGHSLGAALSILYGVYVAKYVLPDEQVEVMNLGSPRVGNEEFYHGIQSIENLKIWRMVYRNDVVPRCPPMWMGYRHVGHLLHWDDDDECFKAYHQQLESCMDSQCYKGIDIRDWNILTGNIGHHKHDNYKRVVERAKGDPQKYWPKGFENIL